MRKLGYGIGAIVLSAAFLGGCSKNSECCGDKQCSDKAAVHMQSDAAPAGGEKKCCKDKANVNMQADAVPASAKQCDGAKACCKGKKAQ